MPARFAIRSATAGWTRYLRATKLPARVVGRATTMRQLNKGRSETDCVLRLRLVQIFKFKTPREPGAHDQIRQDEDRAAGFSLLGG
ncbi:hypothetical protein AC630_30040 [Bradyrhizobium sp. AS23.2]|nr:hypothetical protein AC630_30040 [Bradyrhizobium sp. AS23.2]